MSSPAEQPSLILIQRLADGRVEWVPLGTTSQQVPAAPEAAYTLIDRANYETPQTLVAQRQGEDLVVLVQGIEVLVLDGFFNTTDVAFYPTTNIAGGAGPFTGLPLTPDSPVPAMAAEQVVSAGTDEKTADDESGGEVGGTSPMLWAGLAAGGGLGLLALAGGGGGSGGGESGGSSPPISPAPPAPTPDTVAPQITSGATATAIAENSGGGQVVYTVTATDAGTITYSLKAGGDASAFGINGSTGAVTLTGNPDFETKSSYNFTVVATDAAGNSAERAVSLAINDVNDSGALTITSGTTATPINENSGAQQVVYTVAATGIGVVTYSLKAGVGDAADFTINSSTGRVTLTENPDDETKPSYNFTVVATDAAHNSSERAVFLNVVDLDEVAPTITSGATASPIQENSGPNQVVYTVASTDTGDISSGSTTYSLGAGGDAGAFSINANTGAVTLTGNPNFEAKPSYSFTVVATDVAGNHSERTVSLAINNLDEVAPTITSGATASPIQENSGPNQVVYTVASTDTADISSGSTTYSLGGGGDAGAFSINAKTGAVTLTENPNFEAKPSYSFTVVATDAAGNHSERAVSLAINNLDEVAPTITSGATASPIQENSGPNQVVYTVTSTDTADISSGSTTYSLKPVGDSDAFDINHSTGAVSLVGNPDFETKSSYSFTVVATDAAHNSSEQAISLQIIDVIEDTTPPDLSASTPADGAQDVPVEQNIVLVFSEDVKVGSGTITVKDHGDNRIIDVNDGSQVSVSGNQVTINPTFDLNANGNYEVRIDVGALTDLAGNPFAGLRGGDALHFSTESGRAFQIDASPQIDIRDSTLTAATDDAAIWSGSANLGSDARVMLVGADNPSAPANASIMEAAIAWQADPNEVIEGNPPIHSTPEASMPVAHDAVETHLDIAHLPVAMATSQGLV